jgi:colicin import membrane protein
MKPGMNTVSNILCLFSPCVRAAAAELQRQEDDYKKKCSDLDAKTKDQSTGTVSRNKAVQELAQLKGQDPLPLRKAKITQDAAVRKVEAERKVAEAARQKQEAERKNAEQKREKAEAEREQAEKEREKAVAERERAEKEREQAVAKRETAERERAQAEQAREAAENSRKKAEEERGNAEQQRANAEEQTKRSEEAVVDTEQKFVEASKALEALKGKAGVPHGSVWWLEREVKEARKYMPKSKQ